MKQTVCQRLFPSIPSRPSRIACLGRGGCAPSKLPRPRRHPALAHRDATGPAPADYTKALAARESTRSEGGGVVRTPAEVDVRERALSSSINWFSSKRFLQSGTPRVDHGVQMCLPRSLLSQSLKQHQQPPPPFPNDDCISSAHSIKNLIKPYAVGCSPDGGSTFSTGGGGADGGRADGGARSSRQHARRR